MSLQHSEKCLAEQKKCKELWAAWNEMWPDYCRECDGRGGHHYPGSYDEPPDEEPCNACAMENRCPRCGKDMSWEDLMDEDQWPTCPHCQWGKRDADGRRDMADFPPYVLEGPCECEIDSWNELDFIGGGEPDDG